jgi:hypothetical protein
MANRRPPKRRTASSMACNCRCSAARSASAWRSAPIASSGTCRRRAGTDALPAFAERGAAAARESTARTSTGAVRRTARHYAPQLGVDLPPLSLSAARTRWGSCSLRSGIRLNWRLIHFPPPLIDYVVVHELAHLREMNHGARFWSIVAELYPDYRNARAELKRCATHCPHW